MVLVTKPAGSVGAAVPLPQGVPGNGPPKSSRPIITLPMAIPTTIPPSNVTPADVAAALKLGSK